MTKKDEMDSKRLQEIAARAAAATPGPWVWEHHNMVAKYSFGSDGDFASPDDKRKSDAGDIITTDSGVYGPEPEDREFIAHAREDIPWLLDRVAELEARLATP